MGRTLVTFHAHPDDESIATAGTMAKAKADGHRVVLVLATRGELGEYAPNALADGETIVDRRVAEAEASGKILGVDRIEFLGYVDSGMAGEPTNDRPNAFAAADVDEAAARLAKVLVDVDADVLTTYDDHGVYGHPDHLQVHRVGKRAVELLPNGKRVRLLEATMNRDHLLRLMEMNPDRLIESGEDAPNPEDMQEFGCPESSITTSIDVTEFIDQKRAAMAAHASQIPEDSFFLQMPPDIFKQSFGIEWFINPDAPPGTRETSVFDGLD